MHLDKETKTAIDYAHALLSVFAYTDTAETIGKVILLASPEVDSTKLNVEKADLQFLDSDSMRGLVLILTYLVKNKMAVDEIFCQSVLIEIANQHLSD
jgi:hypothetical protein